jgi:hypothetical protein
LWQDQLLNPDIFAFEQIRWDVTFMSQKENLTGKKRAYGNRMDGATFK